MPTMGIAYPEPGARGKTVDRGAAIEARKRYDLGTWHRIRGEHAEALVKYREALELDPGLTCARNDLAGLLFLTGKHGSAAREFERVLKSDPRHLPALKSLALVQAAQRNYQSSAETLNRLLLIDENDADAWLYLGDVTMFMGDRTAAREYWTRAQTIPNVRADTRERSARRLAIYSGSDRRIASMEP
jgi:tetratricopeptide (TPR) repeat protein